MKLRAGEITRYINTPANTTSVKKCESAPMHSAPMPTPVPKTSGVHRQFQKKWLGQTGIKVIGPSDLCDDDSLNNAGDQMIGLIIASYYSAAHDSPLKKTYVADFQKAAGLRADFTSLGAYDGLHLIYEALKKTGGDADGDKLIAAMIGMGWESPRSPISIDPATRDIVSNIYICKVE